MPNHPVLLEDLKPLMATPELPDLGPKPRPGTLAENQLNERLDALFSRNATERQAHALIRGTLLLWHDHLDSAHVIAQDIEDADGSLLHGMMHRREPDYGNAKYWFRRAGKHPSYGTIATQTASLLASQYSPVAARLIPGGVWAPFAFIDACEEAARKSGAESPRKILQEIQRIEFVAFLEHLGSQG
jgi:hypothetical protein